MHRTVIFLMLCAAPVAAQTPGKVIETLADVPWQLRQPNWDSSRDSRGSCVNASTITILNFLGLYEHATWWRQNFEGGEITTSHIQHMQDSGLKFAYSSDGSEELLEWCSRNRIPAGIFFGQAHAQNFLGYIEGGKKAIVLDNNTSQTYIVYDREAFLLEWRARGSFCWTFIRMPPPPWPSQY